MDVHKEGPDEHTDESAFTLLICKMRRLGSSDETVLPGVTFMKVSSGHTPAVPHNPASLKWVGRKVLGWSGGQQLAW